MTNNRLVNACLLVILSIVCWPQSFAAETWRILLADPSANYYAVRFATDEIGWIVGSGGTISKTTDAGATWQQQVSGTTVDLFHLWFVNASTGWVVGNNGVILKTTNGGTTWTPQTSGTTAQLRCVYFRDAQNGWAGGANGTFLKTTNGGATWTTQPVPTSATFTGGWSPAPNVVFMTCDDGTSLRSMDGGATWQTQWLNYPDPMNSIHFVSPSIGWAVGAHGRIKKTVTGGDVWIIQDGGTTQNLYAVYFVNGDTGWIAGEGGLVKWTTDGGVTWETQNSFTTQTLRSLWFLGGSHGYAVGANSTLREYGFNPLPVQLAYFTATVVNGNSVRLDWRTISEVNNYGFEVQRAMNAPTGFVTLPGSFIPGHGTTNEPQVYSYLDQNVPYGRLYYRLKQIDLDGTFHHSEPISVDVLTDVPEGTTPSFYALKQNYPNPFNPTTTIEFSIAQEGFVSLKVYSTLGEEVATLVSEDLRAGNYRRTFDASGLASGVYLYKLSAGGFVQTKRLVLMK
jgi:photosystem II stability/assembly factor-like uncharacterized protein